MDKLIKTKLAQILTDATLKPGKKFDKIVDLRLLASERPDVSDDTKQLLKRWCIALDTMITLS